MKATAKTGVVIALVAAAIGCGDTTSEVVIADGPVVIVNEGQLARISVDLSDAPESGACAPPFEVDSFAIEGFANDPVLFDTLEFESVQGGIELLVEPRCDAIDLGGKDLLVPVTIRSADGCAQSVDLTIQIREDHSANCAPIVKTWLGDCSVVPDESSPVLVVPSIATPPTACMYIESRDPAAEDLTFKLNGSATDLISAMNATLPPNPILDSGTIHLPLNDTTTVRGEFDLSYNVWFDENQQQLATTGSVRFRVGDPGLGLSVLVDLSDENFTATELDATAIPVQLWRLDDPNPTAPLCLRATRVTVNPGELERKKPFSRVENTVNGRDDSDMEVDWVCGSSHQVYISPPLDAPEQELVQLDVATCSNCDSKPIANPATITSTTISVNTKSVAGTMECGADIATLDNEVVCAQVGGKLTPDVVYHKRGTSEEICIFAGDDDGRHQEVVFPAGALYTVPNDMVSFGWRSPMGVRPVIVGDFGAGTGGKRVLSLSTDDPPIPTWLEASDQNIFGAGFDLKAGAVIAAAPGMGATHFAIPAGRNVQLRCISSVPGCMNVPVAVADPNHTVIHVARADLNGDNTGDLVVFARDNDPPNYVRVHGVPITWPSVGAPAAGAQYTAAGTTVVGGPLRTGSINRNCMSPCPQAVFATSAIVETGTVMQVKLSGTTMVVSGVTTLSTTRDLAGYRNRLIIGMEFGVSEAVVENSEDGVSWLVRDPVILEDRLSGPVTSQDLGYAASVAPCVTIGQASVAFTSDTSHVRWTNMDADVVLP